MVEARPLNTSDGTPGPDHYGGSGLAARLAQALAEAGLGRGPVPWAALAPLDQFHVRGLAATRELAVELRLPDGASVLDVGCGLGGPARCLAAQYGCRVTGIDLSAAFVEAARMLTGRTGLAGQVAFLQADALDLPFPDACFDAVWTQHVAMNIADRAGLYRSLRRVLKPGGALAVYDVVAGPGGPLIFPVPWARTADSSFLLAPEAMREVLGEAGFTEAAWADRTAEGIAWFADQRARQSTRAPSPLGLQVAMGDAFPGMAANLARNLEQGRAGLVQAILQ